MSTFTEDAMGYIADSGDVGGDVQATDAASRRFQKQLDDGTWAVVEVTAYGTSTDHDDTDAALDVEVQLWWTTCTDPTDIGSTEITADVTHEHPFDVAPSDLEQALAWSQSYIRNFDPAHLTWDGSPTTI